MFTRYMFVLCVQVTSVDWSLQDLDLVCVVVFIPLCFMIISSLICISTYLCSVLLLKAKGIYCKSYSLLCLVSIPIYKTLSMFLLVNVPIFLCVRLVIVNSNTHNHIITHTLYAKILYIHHEICFLICMLGWELQFIFGYTCIYSWKITRWWFGLKNEFFVHHDRPLMEPLIRWSFRDLSENGYEIEWLL